MQRYRCFAPPGASVTATCMRFWPITLVLILFPLWCVGLFGRWYWAPDEPREADIAWNMAHQRQKAVPELAGMAFCEKPPLTYWVSGASMAVFGKTPAAARLPNLLWVIIAVLAIAWLAHACAGVPAALVAGVSAATFALSFQVAIWLASDAPLVAGVCVALLGAFRGLGAAAGRTKLAWYTLMHAGLVLGFLAKNIVVMVVPGLALLSFVIWERRWRELLRWELYAGLLLQAAVLVPWILTVAAQPDGRHMLKIFFWDNLVGRFLPVASEANYGDGHRNSPFKYLIELPVYLLPWTFLVAAAAYRAWRGVRDATIDRAAWRWCVCIVVPGLLMLSLSSTGRSIYPAPLMPGFALALGLWAARHVADPDRWERLGLWLTGGLVAFATLVVGPGVLVLAGFTGQTLSEGTIVAVIIGGLAAAALGVKLVWQQRRGAHAAALVSTVLALDLTMLVAWCGAFPLIDRWQNLSPTVARVAAVAENRPLVLWQPDETIIANLDYLADLRPPRIESQAELLALAAREPRLVVFARFEEATVETDFNSLGFVLSERLEIVRGRIYGIFIKPPPAIASPAVL